MLPSIIPHSRIMAAEYNVKGGRARLPVTVEKLICELCDR
jgi:hypothetical protein